MYASGVSLHHQWIPPQAPALKAETIIVSRPSGSTGSSAEKLIGTDQQISGLVSAGWRPVRSARWWKAQPGLPVGPPSRLRKMQAPPTLAVFTGAPCLPV